MLPVETITNPRVKPGHGLLISLFISILVLATGTVIWYLSSTAEFTRKTTRTPAATAPLPQKPPPKAIPVRPPVKPGGR